MSQPGTIYRLSWKPFEEVVMFCDIADNDNLIDDGDTPEIIEVTPNGEAFILSVIDNNEDPFTVIKAQQATIRFNSDENVSMSTFAFGSDERWSVHAYVQNTTRTIFRGFIQIADIVEPFMPTPNVVELTATDNLGTLKDIPVTDFTSENPKGVYRIAEFLTWCLSKTGLSLNMKAAFNIRQKVPSFVADATFQNTGSVIFDTNPNCFEVGYQFTTGSATNPGPFTVRAQGEVFGQWLVLVFEAVVNETATAETFTSSQSGHFFDNQYLDAKTFEEEIGSCINCYEAIERILGHEACLFQRQGKWWALRVDEIEHPTRGLYVYEFDTAGNFDTNHGEVLFDKTILKPGDNYDNETDIFFSQEQTGVGCDRPHKEVALDYDYEHPEEIINNIDFARGEVIDDSNPDLITYEIEDWAIRRRTGSITSQAYIEAVLEDDYEKERYAVITPQSSPATPWDFIQAEPVEVGQTDKGDVSVDYRLGGDLTGGGVTYFPLMVYLKADNGDLYYFWGNGSNDLEEFVWTGPESAEQDRYIPDQFIADNFDMTEWKSFTVELKPFPVAGKLYICLLQMNQEATSEDDVNVNYQNLQFTYKPYINGSYRAYTGQRQTVTQAGGYKAKRKETVYVSESPRKLFKGALQHISGLNLLSDESIIYSAASNAFTVTGYQIPKYYKGQLVFVKGASNQGYGRVISVEYHIVGDTTDVELSGITIVDATESSQIYEASFALSNLFYNGAVYPSDPPAEAFHPYSEIQVYDVWNQFRNEMRIFFANVQGLNVNAGDLAGQNDNCHMVHKWTLADISPHTINRFFFLLTFEQRFFDCEWTGTIREVYNTLLEKSYTGRVFKYISE